MYRAVAYWVALISSILVILLLFLVPLALFTDIIEDILRHVLYQDVFVGSLLMPFVPIITAFLTALSTFSAILLGWRIDRRQARELELKTKDLELKIKELELKLMSAQKLLEPAPAQQKPSIPLC